MVVKSNSITEPERSVVTKAQSGALARKPKPH